MIKLEFESVWSCYRIFKFFDKSIFLSSVFFKVFFTGINSSAKYYQDNKERIQKAVRERYQSLSFFYLELYPYYIY